MFLTAKKPFLRRRATFSASVLQLSNSVSTLARCFEFSFTLFFTISFVMLIAIGQEFLFLVGGFAFTGGVSAFFGTFGVGSSGAFTLSSTDVEPSCAG